MAKFRKHRMGLTAPRIVLKKTALQTRQELIFQLVRQEKRRRVVASEGVGSSTYPNWFDLEKMTLADQDQLGFPPASFHNRRENSKHFHLSAVPLLVWYKLKCKIIQRSSPIFAGVFCCKEHPPFLQLLVGKHNLPELAGQSFNQSLIKLQDVTRKKWEVLGFQIRCIVTQQGLWGWGSIAISVPNI